MPRHGTKSTVLKKRFRLRWNESVGTNGSGSRFPGYNGNSVNVHLQTKFRTHHKCPRENFQQKQSMIYVLLFLTNIIYAVFFFFFDSLRDLKKVVKDD